MCTYCGVDGHTRDECLDRQEREIGTERQHDGDLKTCPDCGTSNNRSVNDSCWRCGYEFVDRELVTDGGQTERKTLKFDSGPSTTLALADHTNSLAATVRYDDEKDLSEGDEIDVLSTNTGEKIGTASVERTEIVPVRKALDVITMHWADYGIQQTEYLISRLNTYYDETITATTDVKVLILNPNLRESDTEATQ